MRGTIPPGPFEVLKRSKKSIFVSLNKLLALEAHLADSLGSVARFLVHFMRQLPDVCSGILSLLAAAFTLLASGCSSSQSDLR